MAKANRLCQVKYLSSHSRSLTGTFALKLVTFNFSGELSLKPFIKAFPESLDILEHSLEVVSTTSEKYSRKQNTFHESLLA